MGGIILSQRCLGISFTEALFCSVSEYLFITDYLNHELRSRLTDERVSPQIKRVV